MKIIREEYQVNFRQQVNLTVEIEGLEAEEILYGVNDKQPELDISEEMLQVTLRFADTEALATFTDSVRKLLQEARRKE